jgi:DNA-binding response OmpR family regulator
MRILLIDQHPRELQTALEQRGLVVDTAKNGKEADRMARSLDYGVIIFDLDVGSQKHDDLSVLKNWRGEGIEAHALVLSTQATLQDKINAFSLGADDLVSKPVDAMDLASRVWALTLSQERSKSSVFVICDLEIDANRRSVRRAGRSIDLTPREYDLLHFLAVHRGKPVSRSMIRAHLYDGKSSNSNVVDVYIRYLRRKIDNGHRPSLILTCWGKGYMLRGDQDAEDAA